MSFDFQLQFRHLPDQAEGAATSAESGNAISSKSLLSSRFDTLREILKSADAPEPDNNGCYHPHMADCSKVEVHLEDQSDSSSIKLRLYGISKDNMRFLFALAKKGDLVILPAWNEETAIVTSENNAQQDSTLWPNAVAVTTPGELMSVLKEGRETLPTFRKEAVAEMKAKSKRTLSSGYKVLLISFFFYIALISGGLLFSDPGKDFKSSGHSPWAFLSNTFYSVSLPLLCVGLMIGSIQTAQDKGYSGELGFSCVLGIPIALFLTAFIISILLRQVNGYFYIGNIYIPQLYIWLIRLLSSAEAIIVLPLLGLCSLILLPNKIRIKYTDMFPA